MFSNCSSLRTIYVSNKWNLEKVVDFEYSRNKFFAECKSLVGGNGTKFNSSITGKTYARIDKPGQPGYFTYKEPFSLKIISVPKAKKGLVYNGKKQAGVAAGKTYTIKGNTAKNAGTYKATLTAKKGYQFAGGKKSVFVKWSIAKAKQSISAKNVSKAYTVKAKNKKLAKEYKINLAKLSGAKAKTSVAFVKASKVGGKYIVVSKNGNVTFKKGLPLKTYTIKVKLTSAGNANIAAAPAKVIVFKVKLK